MGNNGSSYQHQCTSNGFSKFKKTNRGFSQYSKNSLGEKFLPEIIDENLHENIFNDNNSNGNSALTLPHDLNKIKFNKHCQNIRHYHDQQQENQNHRISQCGNCKIVKKKNFANQEKEICSNIKKFKSEPDLRYLMTNEEMLRALNSQRYLAIDEKIDENEIRYRSKKKYKAPLPPLIMNSKISQFQIDNNNKSETIFNDEINEKDHLIKISSSSSPSPPPRKTRLFKTREKSKILNNDNNCQLCSNHRHCTKLKNKQFLHDTTIIDDDNNLCQLLQKEKQKCLLSSHCQKEIISNGSMKNRRFLNWKNKNIHPKESELNHQPSKKIRTNYEFKKDSKEACCSLESRISEKNQLELNFPLGKKFSQQRDKKKSLNSEINSKEFQNQCKNISKFTDIKFFPLNKEDKIQNLITDDNLFALNKIRTNSLNRGINDFNSKLLRKSTTRNDENNLKTMTPKLFSNQRKIDISKSQIDLNANEKKTKQCFNENRHLLENHLLKEKIEDEDNDDGSEEENYLNKSFENKRIHVENFHFRERKDNLTESYYNKELYEPLAKMEKKSLLNKEKRGEKFSQATIDDKNSYLNQNTFPIFNYSKMKTFYFGMDNSKEFNQCVDYQGKQICGDFLKTGINNLENNDIDKEIQNEIDDIALRLRPTLPKKPPEITRFSPSDAWKLLTALEASEPMSTVSDETPVIIQKQEEDDDDDEEEEERLPYPMALNYHRNSQDKSGDSGIDAGVVINEISPLRTTWTPQQDLDDESSGSSDIIYENSSHQFKNFIQFPQRPHVFSLSLPREENRSFYYRAAESKTKQEIHFSDSLQKIKRSVSGALGFTPINEEQKKLPLESTNTIDDNWFLSTSAPTSLQNYYTDNDTINYKIKSPIMEEKPTELFSSQFLSKKHIIYLPQIEDDDLNLKLQFKKKQQQQQIIKYKKYEQKENEKFNFNRQFSKSCENISSHDSNVLVKKEILKTNYMNDMIKDINSKIFNRPKKFTFQSTVRQIERRRLAEKFSKEAEANEMQRKNELEAMIKVEEEFQRKRNKEKENIRYQLKNINKR